MKITLSIILLLSSLLTLQAQQPATNQPLVFNQPFYRYENHWVAFPKNATTGKYPFGFIYIDAMAGFTFNLEGTFTLDDLGLPHRDSSDYIKNSSYKYRLERNTSQVYPIPDEMLQALKVKQEPAWLSVYKRDLNTVASKVSWGTHYNHVGDIDKALQFLESAYKAEPHAKGLEFELSYAYNELKQFNKSVKILLGAIKADPQNEMFYRELAYAYKGANNNSKAIETYLKGLEMAGTRNPEAKAEMAWNLAVTYREEKNDVEYKNWGVKAKEWAPVNSQLAKQLAGVTF